MLELFPPMLLLLLSVMANWSAGVVNNRYSKKYIRNPADIYIYQLICNGVATIVLLILTDSFKVSWQSALMAVGFGIITMSFNLFFMKALQTGPMAQTIMLCCSSTIMPSLSGTIFWHEVITPAKFIGMLLMLLMIPFSVQTGNKEKKINGRWLLYCVIALLSSGFVGVIQKIHQTSAFKDELNTFLLIAFLISTILPLTMFVVARRQGHSSTVTLSPKKGVFWMAVMAGVGIALPNKINLYLSGAMDSVVFFPLVNGGGILLSLIAAVVIFRERPTVRHCIGMVLGFSAILLLCSS